MNADYVVNKKGLKTDLPLHQEMLENKEANNKADLLAVKQAMKMGFTEEEAKRMCGMGKKKNSQDSSELQLIAQLLKKKFKGNKHLENAIDDAAAWVEERHNRDENGHFIPNEEEEKREVEEKKKEIPSTQIKTEKNYEVEVEDLPNEKKYIIHHKYDTPEAAKLAVPHVKAMYEKAGANVGEKGKEILAILSVPKKESEKESEKKEPEKKEEIDELCRELSPNNVNHEFVEEEKSNSSEEVKDSKDEAQMTPTDPIEPHHEVQLDPDTDMKVDSELTSKAEEELEKGIAEEPDKEVEITDSKKCPTCGQVIKEG